MQIASATDKPLEQHFSIRPFALVSVAIVTAAFFVVAYIVTNTYKAKQSSLAQEMFNRGEQELNAGQPAKAIEDLRTALLYSRDNPQYRLRLAQALAANNQLREANAYFRGLWESEPGNALINLNLARLAVRGDNVPDALRFYNGAIYGVWTQNPASNRLAARLELIQFLVDRKLTSQAESELIAAAADAPNDSQLQDRVGDLFMEVRDYARALDQYGRAAEFNPQNFSALAGAATAAFQLGRYRTAQMYLRRAISVQPQAIEEAQLLDTVNSLLEIDPFEHRLTAYERASRVVRGFDQAGERLRQCAQQLSLQLDTDGPATPLQRLYSDWKAGESRVNVGKLIRDPDLVQPTMDLVFQIEQQTAAQCGAPTGADMALLLISEHREGAEQ